MVSHSVNFGVLFGVQAEVTAGGWEAEVDSDHRWGAPYWTQVKILFQRTLKTKRFQTLNTQDIIIFMYMGTLAGESI